MTSNDRAELEAARDRALAALGTVEEALGIPEAGAPEPLPRILAAVERLRADREVTLRRLSVCAGGEDRAWAEALDWRQRAEHAEAAVERLRAERDGVRYMCSGLYRDRETACAQRDAARFLAAGWRKKASLRAVMERLHRGASPLDDTAAGGTERRQGDEASEGDDHG